MRPPLVIGAPTAVDGQRAMFYMPNNDLDAVQADPRRVAEIRTATKFSQPRLFIESMPILYAWSLPEGENEARRAHAVSELVERVFQFGRGSIWPGLSAKC